MAQTGLELEKAVSILMDYIKPLKETEEVMLMEADGRIIAEDIYSPIDNPPFDRSPLDGFAVRSEDIADASQETPVSLKIADIVYAGGFSNYTVKSGEAVRIMTGAPIPSGADCVIRQEDTHFTDMKNVQIFKTAGHYENYCFAGEDIKKGNLLIENNTKLTYIELAILASVGMNSVKVYKKPLAALFVTGDELVLPGNELKNGKIYDSNLHLIYGRMKELGIAPVIFQQVEDEPEAVAAAIKKAADSADIIITTGGVSVGDKDIFHQVLPLLGAEQVFWRINMKPGTPAMFAVHEGTPMLHLSGNPFAAITTFELLARPALARLSGDTSIEPLYCKAVLDNEFGKESKNRRFLRGRFENGIVIIPPTNEHSSGMLASMKNCNCLVDVPAGSKTLKKGCQIDVVLL